MFYLKALKITVLAAVIAVTTITSFAAHAGDREGNGGDAFDASADGQGLKFFDFTEFGASFDVTTLPEFEPIKQTLEALEKAKLSKTSAALASLPRAILWSFVTPALKDVPTTGGTNIVLTYKKIQAAVSVPSRMTIQINRGVWDSLDSQSRSYLLLHELLWIAEKSATLYQQINPAIELVSKPAGFTFDVLLPNGRLGLNENDIQITSEGIRRLTGYLLQPDLGQILPRDTAQFLTANLASVTQKSYEEQVDTDCSDDDTGGHAQSSTVTFSYDGWLPGRNDMPVSSYESTLCRWDGRYYHVTHYERNAFAKSALVLDVNDDLAALASDVAAANRAVAANEHFHYIKGIYAKAPTLVRSDVVHPLANLQCKTILALDPVEIKLAAGTMTTKDIAGQNTALTIKTDRSQQQFEFGPQGLFQIGKAFDQGIDSLITAGVSARHASDGSILLEYRGSVAWGEAALDGDGVALGYTVCRISTPN